MLMKSHEPLLRQPGFWSLATYGSHLWHGRTLWSGAPEGWALGDSMGAWDYETFQHVWYIRHFVVNFCYLPSDFLLTHWAPADWHPKICFSSSNVRHGIQSFGPGSLLCRSVEALGTCVVASSFGKIGSGRGLAAKRKDFQVASTTSRSLSWQISSKTLEEATEEWEVPEVEHQKCGKETGLAPMIFIAHFVAA